MSSALIVSVSGIRGIVGESLTPEVALAFAQALGTYLGEGKVVAVSRDNRPSGVMFGQAVSAGLLSAGCAVLDLGIVPTPTIGVVIRDGNLGGGIQISASHNPAQWNGLKLFGSVGAVLAPTEGAKLVEFFKAQAFHRTASFRPTDYGQSPRGHEPNSPLALHRRLAAALADVEAVRRKGFRVFVDANGGAGGLLARDLLQDSLGCMVEGIGLHPSDTFAHMPEPTSENLQEICPLVAKKRCAIGFALDPDADRLAIIDERGEYIGEEMTFALALEYVLRRTKGPVVVNMSSSRVSEDIAKRHGCTFYRSAVGEANVVLKMRQVEAILGGEGNGGVIDPRVGWVRDPFVGMALILTLLAEENRPLSQVVHALPKYVIQKDKYNLAAAELPTLFRSLRQKYPDAVANEEDGLRLDWRQSWVHVRPSNTEPIVRVIAEAPTADQAADLCQAVGALLGQK